MKKIVLLLITTLLIAAMLPLSAFAGSSTSGEITLSFPDNMIACNPTFKFTTTGIDPSWEVWYDLFKSEAGVLVKIGGGKTFGDLDVSFTPDPLSAGETQVYGFSVAVFVPGKAPTKLGGQWRVDCDKEPPGGGEGCTPGFWKNHEEVWPIALDTDFDFTFGRDVFDPNITMFDAVGLKGGQVNALSRHAAAAYLNALSPVVNFDLTSDQVISYFQAAIDSGDYNATKNMFEDLNELGCPY